MVAERGDLGRALARCERAGEIVRSARQRLAERVRRTQELVDIADVCLEATRVQTDRAHELLDDVRRYRIRPGV